MLRRTINAIRKKPKAVKDQYAFWTAAICTSVVAIVWLGGLVESVEPLERIESDEPALSADDRESLTEIMSDFRSGIGSLELSDDSAEVVPVPAAATATPPAASPTPVALPAGTPVRIATFTATSALPSPE